MDRPNLINEPNPWHRPEAYRPDLYEALASTRMKHPSPSFWADAPYVALVVFCVGYFGAQMLRGAL